MGVMRKGGKMYGIARMERRRLRAKRKAQEGRIHRNTTRAQRKYIGDEISYITAIHTVMRLLSLGKSIITRKQKDPTLQKRGD